MRYIILACALVALLVVPQFTYASCQTVTIFNPDGSIKTCNVCTTGSNTTVSCF